MDAIRKIKIIQHNVVKWTSARKNELSNYYIKEQADIILLNSTGIPNENRIKLFNYNIYQKNISGEESPGIAVAIKRTIKHKLIDDFDLDMLAIKIDTTKGPIIISTTYLPPIGGGSSQ